MVTRSSAAPIEQMYRDHHDVVLRYFQRRAPELADDLASETYLKALCSPYNGVGKPLHWLYCVAHSVFIQYLRTRGRYWALSIEGLQSPPRFDDARIDKVAADDAFAALLEPLTPIQRRVIELRFVHQCTAAGIAEQVGGNEGTVRATQLRGLRAIRKHLHRE